MATQEFCEKIANNFPDHLLVKGILEDCQVIYSGGGIWLVWLAINETTYIQAGDGGFILCSKETDEDLAIIGTATSPTQIAKEIGKIWEINR